MSDTYTDRHMHWVTVESVDPLRHDGLFGNPPPPEMAAKLAVGDTFGLEMRGGPFGTIAGWTHNDVWYGRKSDQDMEREHEEMLAGFECDKREQLEANREDWERRTAALPDWLQARIRTFIDRGGERFALDGWGYELVVCELAAAYPAEPAWAEDPPGTYGNDPEAVKVISQREGTSGNQHDMAKALARAHLEDPERSLAGTVSALSPITGDAYYEGDG